MQFLIPKYVEEVIKTIENHSGEAFIVGGCVRDILLSKTPDDYDVTTSLYPEEIISIFNKTIPTGIKHGTVTVIIDKKPVEVTTYRTDGSYSDSRHPENVVFVKSLKEDLARRDFTVNAMAYNHKCGVVDFMGGIGDLKNKILKTVGDANTRFKEDALRILRLFRFSAQLNFSIEENTLNSAISLSDELENISRERIFVELVKTLLSDNPQNINKLLSVGALKFCGINEKEISPNLSKLKKERNLRFFAFIKENDADFNTVCKELKTDKALLKFCNETDILCKSPPKNKVECKKALSSFSKESVYASMLLNGVDISLIEKTEESGEPYKLKDLAINGDALKSIGISGKKTGEILNKLLNIVIENPLLNEREKLIEISRNQ
ncbi:MAG: CCA tRNA nucleotidyltransferase [Ruminococcaceae bacterium]|nr:CCA tRNA nucleotidyltransferase [Oscillospiraceae bacterium]